MTWAWPWAWALTVAAILPLVAHLWSRRRPAAILFPTLRFLRAASPISRRLHRVQAWPLLLLRLLIVAAVCAAAAGPTLEVSWRQAAWRERLHRIILVDVGLAANETATVVAQLQRSASSSTVHGPAAIAEVLAAAIAQASTIAPQVRTELVLVWDGSRASLAAGDVDDVPANVGVQLVVQDRAATPTASDEGTLAAALRIELPPGEKDLEGRLRASAETLRLPAPAVPVTVRWAEAGQLPSPPDRQPRGVALPGVVVRALEDIAADPRVRDAAERSARAVAGSAGGTASAGSMVLARASDGTPLLRGFGDGRSLVLDFATAPGSPLTWWALVSAGESLARLDAAALGRWSASEVTAARRSAPLPPAASLPGGLDTRAAWAVVLALLALEQFWRGRPAGARGAAGSQQQGTSDVAENSDAA